MANTLGTVSSAGNVPSPKTEFYDRLLLERAKPLLIHGKFGQTRNLPAKESKQIKFRKYSSFAAITTPLTEGTTPSGQDLTVTDITAEIYQYGGFIQLTDMIEGIVPDNVKTESYEILGDQMGLSIDTLDRNVINAGTSVRYANGVAGYANVITKLSTTDLKIALRALFAANAKMFYDEIKASTGVGTKGIARAFVCICHTDAIYDLEDLTGFIPVQDYANSGQAMEGEVGSWKNIRFIATTNAFTRPDSGALVSTSGLKTSGTKVDVYTFVILAKNAYGVIDLDGMSMNRYEEGLGSAGSADPLHQRMTIAWKTAHTAKILDNSWMYRIEAGVTA